MVPSMVLSQEDEIWRAAVTIADRIEVGTVESTLGHRRKVYTALPMSMKLELRIVFEKNISLPAALKEYKLRVKNLAKQIKKEKSNEILLRGVLKWSEREIERVKCEKKLLRQTAESKSDSRVLGRGYFFKVY